MNDHGFPFADDSQDVLPDGWENDDDLFTLPDDDDPGPSPDAADPPVSSGPDNGKVSPADSPDDVAASDSGAIPGNPQTSDSGGQNPQADPSPDSNASDVTQKNPGDPSRKTYRLRVNHQDREVQLSDEEVIDRLRLSYALEDKANRTRFNAVYHQQIAEGMPDAVARLVARDAVNGKTYPIDPDNADSPDHDDSPSGIPDTQTQAVPDSSREAGFREQLRQIKDIYPDFSTVPADVLSRVANDGVSLLTAYVQYRNQQSEQSAQSAANADAQKLRAENAQLKQQRQNALRAPVRGVTGNGFASDESKTDYFLKGFDADLW